MSNNRSWISAQFGAREFYSIPQILNHLGFLDLGFTDVWIENTWLRSRNSKFKSRFNPSLKGKIKHNTIETLACKFFKKDAEIAFDDFVAKQIKRRIQKGSIFYTYSYSSLNKICVAKEKGAKIVYGQINPGEFEAEIVKKLYADNFPKEKPSVPSAIYWQNWKQELLYADKIIVNSNWSKKLMIESNVPEDKIEIIPLIYNKKQIDFIRVFPSEFNSERKLRLLYLGAMSVRKGFHVLLSAMQKILDLPIELIVVGRINGPFNPQDFPKNIVYKGAVSPSDIDSFYKQSDVFILPTFSDGFALTQLEAQNYKMPIITSPYCGEVIKDAFNGFILDEISATNLVDKILRYFNDPSILHSHSIASNDLEDFSLEAIAKKFSYLSSILK